MKFANGCYGGVNQKGEVFLNFFTESPQVPDKECFELDKEGRLSNLLQDGHSDPIFERRLVSGLVLTKKSAQEICDWLQVILQNS